MSLYSQHTRCGNGATTARLEVGTEVSGVLLLEKHLAGRRSIGVSSLLPLRKHC